MGHSRHKPAEAGTMPPVTYVHRDRTNTTRPRPGGPGRSITFNSSQTAWSSDSTAGTSTAYPREPSTRQSRFVVSCCRGWQQCRCIVSATIIFTPLHYRPSCYAYPFRCAPETNARLPLTVIARSLSRPAGCSPASARCRTHARTPRVRTPGRRHARTAGRTSGRPT